MFPHDFPTLKEKRAVCESSGPETRLCLHCRSILFQPAHLNSESYVKLSSSQIAQDVRLHTCPDTVDRNRRRNRNGDLPIRPPKIRKGQLKPRLHPLWHLILYTALTGTKSLKTLCAQPSSSFVHP